MNPSIGRQTRGVSLLVAYLCRLETITLFIYLRRTNLFLFRLTNEQKCDVLFPNDNYQSKILHVASNGWFHLDWFSCLDQLKPKPKPLDKIMKIQHRKVGTWPQRRLLSDEEPTIQFKLEQKQLCHSIQSPEVDTFADGVSCLHS